MWKKNLKLAGVISRLLLLLLLVCNTAHAQEDISLLLSENTYSRCIVDKDRAKWDHIEICIEIEFDEDGTFEILKTTETVKSQYANEASFNSAMERINSNPQLSSVDKVVAQEELYETSYSESDGSYQVNEARIQLTFNDIEFLNAKNLDFSLNGRYLMSDQINLVSESFDLYNFDLGRIYAGDPAKPGSQGTFLTIKNEIHYFFVNHISSDNMTKVIEKNDTVVFTTPQGRFLGYDKSGNVFLTRSVFEDMGVKFVLTKEQRSFEHLGQVYADGPTFSRNDDIKIRPAQFYSNNQYLILRQDGDGESNNVEIGTSAHGLTTWHVALVDLDSNVDTIVSSLFKR